MGEESHIHLKSLELEISTSRIKSRCRQNRNKLSTCVPICLSFIVPRAKARRMETLTADVSAFRIKNEGARKREMHPLDLPEPGLIGTRHCSASLLALQRLVLAALLLQTPRVSRGRSPHTVGDRGLH